jgi:cell division protein FtsI/penicillin-binding protein 2
MKIPLLTVRENPIVEKLYCLLGYEHMRLRASILLLIFFLTACAQVTAEVIPTQTSTLKPLPVAGVTIIPAPKVDLAALAFLEAWQAEDYPAMYAMLTSLSQDALAPETFNRRYIDVAINTTLENIDFEILSTLTNPTSAQVSYRVTFHTKMLGDLTREMKMNLSLEKDDWRVQWDDGLILPELKGGNTLLLDLKAPTRGNIYDRNGSAVAAANDIVAIGIIKGQTDPEQEGRLLSELSRLTGKDAEWIKALYSRTSIYDGTYVPIGEVPRDDFMARYNTLSGLAGLSWSEYKGRFYYNEGIAPHVTGYVAAIQAEEKDTYLREGFRLDDRVGKAGLELWAESYLLGQRGATLTVVDPSGSPVTRLAQVDSKPSQSVYMTIDSKLQIEAQKAMAGFSGAIVVLERDTGRVLAMVSAPGFDPNAFEYQGNNNSVPLLGMIYGDGRARLYNRAAASGYPLGSVFKIISLAAALESDVFTPEDKYDCQHFFTEIANVTLKDWTYDKGIDPSGILTLPESLTRSCNPWYYKIGMELFRQGKANAISDMARALGLGSSTGIQGLDIDGSGNIPNPPDEYSAALISIGQAEVLVNPLQVARLVAAVGNGGTLYRPQVVEKIVDPDGNASFTFSPESQGQVPISPENLAIIQKAMRDVVSSPRGTAIRAFSGFSVPVYGKTGTAQSDLQAPHAWFAAYTEANRADKPDIAVAVIAEYTGEGSDIAAPIARRILEVYYLGQPQRVYPWESRIYVTRTPTPSESETPATPVPAQQQPSGGDNSGAPVDDGGINLRTATPVP